MKTYNIYKHKNCIDVAIIPLKTFYIKESDTWKIKVRWIIYKHDGKKQHDLHIDEKITIASKDLKNWINCGQSIFFIQ